MARREEAPEPVYRITGAAAGRSGDLDRRVTRYLISMAVRTACVVLVFVVPGPAKWLFAIGAILLPYVAVLFANAGDRRTGDGPAPVDHRGIGAAAPPAQEPQVLHGQVVMPEGTPPEEEPRGR